MKKDRIIMISIYAFLILAVIAFVFILNMNKYSTSLVMDNDGYIISRDTITKNLFSTKMDMKASYDAVGFQSSDIIYQKLGKYYIGDDKTEINADFPLYVNNGATVMNLTDEISLITDNFEVAKSYSGLYVSNGLSYNPDMEQAYRENFNLLRLANGLYINTEPITAEGNFFTSQTIPVNSIIRFMEQEIRYYSLDKGVFTPKQIQPVNKGTKLSIVNADYAYYDFLEKLGLYEKAVETKKEATPTVKATPTPTVIPVTEDSLPQGDNASISDQNNSQIFSISDQNVELRRNDSNRRIEPTATVAAEQVLPVTQKPEVTKSNEITYSPTPTNIAVEEAKSTPKPAKLAAPAALPQAVPSSAPEYVSAPQTPEIIPTDIPAVEDKPTIKNWKKPTVTLGKITTSVYSLLSPGMVVENSEFLYRTGIAFNIYQNSKLVMKKTFTTSNDIKIGPLKPDTDYHLEVQMDYVDKYGARVTEAITKADVHTKPLSNLTPIKLNWSNGQVFYSKIQLKDFAITNAISSASNAKEVSYIETVQYMSRVEVSVTSVADSKVSYALPVGAQDLTNLRTGKPVLYNSPGKIASNTQYEYEFNCYDRFGNLLPKEGSVNGTTHTCKQPPKADITLLKNEVKNIELSISVQNPDAAQITDKSLYFSVYDKNNNPVSTTITRKDKDGNKVVENEYSEAHAINLTGNVIQFNDLLDYEVYTIRVFCDYDINDDAGVYKYAPIGETSFTTTPIATLGFAFFNVDVKQINDNKATVEITLDTSRTNTKLVQLINVLDISFTKTSTKDGTGTNVTYYRKGQEPAAQDPEQEIPEDQTVNNGKITMKDEELALMKAWDGNSEADKVTYVFNIDKLSSNTEYTISIVPKVRMGSQEHAVDRMIDTFFSPDKFKTMKKSPVIDIETKYASDSFIQLYGVSVNDPDGAIISYPINVYVYDDKDRQVASFKLLSKDKTKLIDVQKLEKDKTYTFRFFANEYNNGDNMTTYFKNYELYTADNFEKKQYLKITTHEAITGSIEMQQLNRIKKILSQEFLAKNITSYNKNITLYQNYRFSSNSQVKAKFSLNADFGQEFYDSFSIGYSYVNRATRFNFYTVDPDTNPGATAFASLLVDGLTRSSENCRWTDAMLFNNGQSITGAQKIYIVASTVDGKGGIDCLWGIRFHKTQTSDAQHYYANINTMVNDVNGELAIPSYQVKIYEDNNWIDTRRHEWTKNTDGSYTLKMYKVAPDKSETLVDIKSFSGKEHECNTDFYYEVEKGHHTYRFELWTDVYTYQIQLDKVEFTTEKEIIGIRTADELADVRYGLDKKYYVLNDIVFPLGWNNITNNYNFDGELDFRGHTLKYNSTGNLISTIGYYGILKNLIFTYVDGYGSDVERRGNRIVTSNYGHIQNLLLRINNGNVAQTYYTDNGAICYTNYESGVIENFVVKNLNPLIGGNTYADVCALNRGTIRNGYIYGEPMVRTSENNMNIDQYTTNILTGGIVAVNRQSGTVENVYSLVNIQTRENKSINDYGFGLIGLNDGTIRNSFYAGEVTYGGKTWTDHGPAYRNRYSASYAGNVYYYSPVDYGNTDNKKIAKTVLYDEKWYNRMFDRSGSSVTGQFDYGPVAAECYPHVVWPECMPNQEYIALPERDAQLQPKIVDTEVTEQGDDYAKAVITFENPDECQITGISAQWLNTEILSQEKDGKKGEFYRVTVRMTLAKDTKFYSSYNIISFTYRLSEQGTEKKFDYLVADQPIVYAEFYKPITSTTGWASMKDDYKQNYRLYADLNFQFLDSKVSVIPSNAITSTTITSGNGDIFWGKLDGNNHKISFVDTGTYGYVFGKLKGTIKNLTVEDLDATKGTTQFKGFIGRMLEGSLVDNVHIFRMNAVSYEHCGAIAGDVFASTIINSSAHDIKISTTADGNFTQYVGGLVGKHRITGGTIYANLVIFNSYVDGLEINVMAAGDCGGAGGLVGYIRASAEISHVYVVNGTINTVYKNVGGLIGAVDTYTNSESNLYLLKDYYVDVDITSITERCGGVIGFSTVANGEKEEHGLVLGNTVTSLTDPKQVGRYYGYATIPSSKVYSSDTSILNGKLNTDSSLLSYATLCNSATYQIDGPLYWDKDFVVDEAKLSQGVMPKLNKTDGSGPVMYQRDYYLENNPIKIKSVTSKNYSTGELYIIQIEAEHPQNMTITGATFRGLLPADLGEGVEAVTITNSGNLTTLKYILRIEGYYDSYFLNGVTYKLEGSADTNTQSMYLNVGIAPQYYEIGSMDEWNTWMSKERYGLKGYNIRITGDLDFTSYGSAANNVIVNHIEGVHDAEGGSLKTIKGINMVTQDSFIKAAYGNVSYLNFENITLKKSVQTSVNSYAIIESITGDMHHVNFTNCKVEANNSSYTGVVALAYGKNYNITMNAITVRDTYTAVPSKLGVGGLIGKLSGAGGIYDTSATNLIIQGRDYVGGIVGIQDNGKYLWNLSVDNAVVYATNYSNSYIGGIAGYADAGSLEDIFGKCSVKHAVIAGSTYVGAIAGVGSLMGNTHLSLADRDKDPNVVEQCFILGTNAYIGGASGQGVVHRTQVKDCDIYGLYYVGGVTGNGAAIFDSCVDSTISTQYDRSSSSDTTNTAFVNGVNSQIGNYNTKIAATTDQLKINVYNEAKTVLSGLITTARISTWSPKSFSGNNNTRIAGISARTISATNCMVANCRIGAYQAISVGGIVSRTELSSYNNGPYRIMACGVQNSEIYGAEDIGGIVGSHLRSYIESCYCSANVTATRYNAGGMAGRIKATSLYSTSETPYVNHVYYVGTVSAPNYAAGIVGKMEQDLYNVNQGWLMAGNVQVTDVEGTGSFFVNKQIGDAASFTKALIYEDSTIKYAGTSTNALLYYQNNPSMLLKDGINFATTADMKTRTTYTDKLLWSSDLGITSSNYSTRYWKYNGLTNGYMPYLSCAPYNNYYMANSIRIGQYQEGYKPSTADPTKAMVDANGMYVYKYESYDGGVPIPGSGAGLIKAKALARTVSADLPRAEFYTVDADKLNIEFNQVNENATFIVEANGVKVAESKVDKRTFTLNYDFKSELKITVSNKTDKLSFDVLPEDVSRNIMTWKSDYYYIASNQVDGSNPILKGQYMNLYAGHALDVSGSIYDVEDGKLLGKVTGITLLDKTTPLHSFTYDGYQLETYKNYTLVGEVSREKLRLYVKNEELSAVSSSLAAISDSIILDNYNGSKYCSVLSTEGKIVDMTDSKLKLPDKFVNSDIQYMTSNLDSTDHILLVRYYDGAVAGFNYITGELLDIDSPRGMTTEIVDENAPVVKSKSTSMTNFATLYIDAMNFAENLTALGWAEVNGSNIVDGDAVTTETGVISEDNSMQVYVENTFVLDDGTIVKLNPDIVPTNSVNSLNKLNSSNAGKDNAVVTGEAGMMSDTSAAQNADAGNSEKAQEVINAISSIQAAINVVEISGGTLTDISRIETQIDALKNNGVPETVIEELKATLKNAITKAKASGKPVDAAVDALKIMDADAKDNSQAVNQKDIPKKSSGKDQEQTALEEKDKIEASSLDKGGSRQQSVNQTDGFKYIPVYDADQSKYVLYSDKDLLTKKDKKLKTVNKKVEESGHMIDYRSRQRAKAKQSDDDNTYGFILLAAAILGITALLGSLVFKKGKEADQ